MALKYFFKPSFEKAFDQLSRKDQLLTLKSLEAIRLSIEEGRASPGLGIKKLYEKGGYKTFEARLSLGLRIVWVQSRDSAFFTLLGDHNDVRKFLKNF